MIAFASLFLGLTLGLQPVEMVASGEVATVEIRLGGRPRGVIEGPPWTMDVDFGSELVPQLLEAVALDREGQVIGRARQLAGAVAVAGLTAYQRQRRRAAVLVLGAAPPGGGHITPAQSRRYLEHLKVPFFVWTVARASAESVWGEAVNVSTYEKLKKAFAELSAEVDRQWIVWFDGVHLPQDVRLSAAAEGITLRPAG